jgi:hypothetical protein
VTQSNPAEYASQKRYWPFDVLPVERQTGQHKREIRFFETAYREGCQPFTEFIGHVGATSGDRGALILVRGHAQWEILLGSSETTVASGYFDDFDKAAEVVLRWLRGTNTSELVRFLQEYCVTLPGASRSSFVEPT